MATELEDHNDGQRDGADAGFLDSLAVSWNPFLSSAYKRGFRHAEQQQSQRRAREERERKDSLTETNGDSPDAREDEEMPWFLALLFAYFALVLTGIFFVLRWLILRPWRVAVALVVVACITVWYQQAERPRAALLQPGEAPLSAAYPSASSDAVSSEEAFGLLGVFSNEKELTEHFDPTAEPRMPYRVALWKHRVTEVVGHLYYPVQEADSPVARLERGVLDEGSGKISFQARLWAGNTYPENQPVYDIHSFSGVLRDGVLQGVITRQDEKQEYSASEEHIALHETPVSGMDDFATLAQWEAAYSTVVMSRWE